MNNKLPRSALPIMCTPVDLNIQYVRFRRLAMMLDNVVFALLVWMQPSQWLEQNTPKAHAEMRCEKQTRKPRRRHSPGAGQHAASTRCADSRRWQQLIWGRVLNPASQQGTNTKRSTNTCKLARLSLCIAGRQSLMWVSLAPHRRHKKMTMGRGML